MWLRPKLFVTAVVPTLLCGCAQQIVATAKPFCAAVKDVTVSRDDVLTDGTARQIRQNIVGRKRVCGA